MFLIAVMMVCSKGIRVVNEKEGKKIEFGWSSNIFIFHQFMQSTRTLVQTMQYTECYTLFYLMFFKPDDLSFRFLHC